MRDTVVAGVGMTTFGKQTETPYTALVADAVRQALADARCGVGDVQLVYYANTGAGLVQGQESVRGQHAVRGSGLEGVPLVNYLTAPWYLFDSADTMDKVDHESLDRVSRAAFDIVESTAGRSAQQMRA